MAVFEVYVPEESAMPKRGDAARFLAERVSVLAIIIPALWLIWHRLWFALAVYLLVAAFIAGLGATDYAGAAIAISFLPGVYLFLEGANLIAAKWRGNGFVMDDLVEADTIDNAELIWVSRQKLSVNSIPATQSTPVQNVSGSIGRLHRDEQPNFGLFAED